MTSLQDFVLGWCLCGLVAAMTYYGIVRHAARFKPMLPTSASCYRQTIIDVGLMLVFGPAALLSLIAFVIHPPHFRVIGWTPDGVPYGEELK